MTWPPSRTPRSTWSPPGRCSSTAPANRPRSTSSIECCAPADAPNPLAPTYGEAIAAALTRDERDRLEAYMTTTRARTRRTMATAYLRAQKAGAPQED